MSSPLQGRLRPGPGSIVVNSLGTQPARASGEFAIGGDLPVVRLGDGAMRITGPGVWGEPRDHEPPTGSIDLSEIAFT